MARGFSLVEVLVALLVVFLLAAVLYGGVAGVGTWGRDRVSCTYGGLVQVYLADGARKELRSPQEYLQDLGLPWGSPPPGLPGQWLDCGGERPWGRSPQGTQCRVRVDETGAFQVATWRGQALCVNGMRR